jgi:hypothetical protein
MRPSVSYGYTVLKNTMTLTPQAEQSQNNIQDLKTEFSELSITL